MAHFIGRVHGSRKSASRLGSAASGITVSASGWNVGIEVRGYVNSAGKDTFDVYLTSGSNGCGSDTLIGTFTEKDIKK